MLGVAEMRSAWAGALFDGAIVGYDDLGLTSGSAGGGASGGAAADATAVLMVSVYKMVEYLIKYVECRRCDGLLCPRTERKYQVGVALE